MESINGAFGLDLNTLSVQSEVKMPFGMKLKLADLERKAASSLLHVRNILAQALKETLREIDMVEKEFYGSKNTKVEVGKIARMMTKLMKQVNLRYLTEPIHMERLATRAAYHDEADLTPLLKQARSVYEKTWKYVPGELQPIIEKIETILRYQKMYCPPVYDPISDPSILIAKDYQIKFKSWNSDVKKYLSHTLSLYEKFQKGTLYLEEMSQNTRELAMKVEAENCPFVFAFYDSCEVMREAIKCLQDWLTVANEYSNFLTGEMEDLQQQRIKVQHKALKQQDNYNKENYRLHTLRQELDIQKEEQAGLQSKEMELLVREELLQARVAEMRIDFDIKEFRLAEMHRTINPKTASPSTLDAMNKLAEEVRIEGHELNDINKELALIKLKSTQLVERQENYRKMSQAYEDMVHEVKKTHRNYLTTMRQLNRINHTVDHIKYMVQYLTTPDTAQKIFLNLPRRREALGISRSHGLHIQGGDDMMDQVFDVLSNYLGKRWPQIYRELPFYPVRGTNTIETDIRQIQIECVRDSLNKEVRKSLERWRRFHTRARPAELLSVVERLGDKDILRAIDRIVNPPRPKTPVPETFPTFLDESLIPYYQQVSRYDSLRHQNKREPSTLVK